MYERIGEHGRSIIFYNRLSGVFLNTDKQCEALVSAHNCGATWPEIEQTVNASAAEMMRHLWSELDRGAKTSTEIETPPLKSADIEWEQSGGLWNSKRSSDGGFDRLSIQTRNTKIVIEVSKAAAGQVCSALDIFDATFISEPQNSAADIVITQLENGQFRKRVKPTKYYYCDEHTGSFEKILGYLVKDLAELSIDYSACAGVLHCATLHKNSTRLLICNPSKSGKTTLAWLLASCGYSLIHDDIFPILKDNRTQQVNTLSVTRIGSDEVLKQHGFHHGGKSYVRNNQQVRFKRLAKQRDIIEVEKTIILFVNFSSIPVDTKIVSLEKLECFQRIVSEECVIVDRSISNLSFLFDWFSSHQYFEVTYSDFCDVPRLLDEILNEAI